MQKSVLAPFARSSRTVAAAVIAGFTRRGDADAVEARLCALPVGEQTRIVGATLAGLFTASLLAAQFGLPGILAFVLAVIVLVR